MFLSCIVGSRCRMDGVREGANVRQRGWMSPGPHLEHGQAVADPLVPDQEDLLGGCEEVGGLAELGADDAEKLHFGDTLRNVLRIARHERHSGGQGTSGGVGVPRATAAIDNLLDLPLQRLVIDPVRPPFCGETEIQIGGEAGTVGDQSVNVPGSDRSQIFSRDLPKCIVSAIRPNGRRSNGRHKVKRRRRRVQVSRRASPLSE